MTPDDDRPPAIGTYDVDAKLREKEAQAAEASESNDSSDADEKEE